MTTRFCASDGRGWTDAISNLTLMPHVDLRKHLRAILQGAFPKEILPSFLHESVHHWCFHSVVGSALALAHLRASRRVLLDASGEEQDELDICDDVIRFETASSMLRSISEGMALFAEFDVVVPSYASVTSSPLTTVYRLFATPTEEEVRDNFGYSLFALLNNWRKSSTCIDRKKNVLSQSITHSQGGYLCGYLIVKNLWLCAASKCQELTNKDTFLIFLRSYFYHDYGLVEAILNSDYGENGAADRIAARVQTRIHQFVDLDFDNEVGRLITEIGREPRIPNRSYEIAADAATSALGRELLDGSIQELAADADETLSAILGRMDFETLAQRAFVVMGTLPVRFVRGSNYGCEVIDPLDGATVAMLSLDDNQCKLLDPGETAEGSMDVIVAQNSAGVALAFNVKHSVLNVRFHGSFDSSMRDVILGLNSSHRRIESWHSARADRLGEFIDQRCPAGKIVLKHVRSQLPDIQDRALLKYALLFVPEGRLSHVAAEMSNNGLSALFDDPSDFDLFCRLSLVVSDPMPVNLVRALVPDAIEPRFFAALNRVEQTWHVPLVNMMIDSSLMTRV